MSRKTFKPIRFEVARDTKRERFTLSGRNAWALSRLVAAGKAGVSPLSEPSGPRWSAYVHNLRRMGLSIETRHESHAGPFPGSHGRYVLWDAVRVVREDEGRCDG